MKRFLAILVGLLAACVSFGYEASIPQSGNTVIQQNGGYSPTNTLYVGTIATEEWVTNKLGNVNVSETVTNIVNGMVGGELEMINENYNFLYSDITNLENEVTNKYVTYETTQDIYLGNVGLRGAYGIKDSNGASIIYKQGFVGGKWMFSGGVESAPKLEVPASFGFKPRLEYDEGKWTLQNGDGANAYFDIPFEEGECFITSNTVVSVIEDITSNLSFVPLTNNNQRVVEFVGSGDNRGIVVGNSTTNLVLSGKQIIAASPTIFRSNVQFNSTGVANADVTFKNTTNVKFADLQNKTLASLLEGESINPIAKLYDDKKEVTWTVSMVDGDMKIYATSPNDDTAYIKVNSVMTDTTTSGKWNVRMDNGEMKFKTNN